MIEIAHAKINLALHVRRRRPDGYHDIETLFAFAEDGDRLRLERGGTGPALTIGGTFGAAIDGAVEDNLILRAAARFADSFGGGGDVRFHLDKWLPVAAGIGGGSADAAAALRLLARAEGVPLDDRRLGRIAEELGADVPACLRSVAVRGDGKGDALRPVDAAGLAGLPLLLVNPAVPMATGPVFAGWDGADRGALADDDPLAAAKAGRNDLEAPARALAPVIADLTTLLARLPGVMLARMSGSGATCFALFESEETLTVATASITDAHPDWWCLATRLRR